MPHVVFFLVVLVKECQTGRTYLFMNKEQNRLLSRLRLTRKMRLRIVGRLAHF